MSGFLRHIVDMLILTTSEAGYSDDRVFGLVQRPQSVSELEGASLGDPIFYHYQ